MRTYCKDADPTNVSFIEPAVWDAFRKKWKRYDYGSFLAAYGGMSYEEAHAHAINHEYEAFSCAIRNITEEISRRIKARSLDLGPVRYEWRVDGSSGKRREIGIETVMHQIMEHVAVRCLSPLFKARIEDCEYASIKGRGQEKGAKRIASWVRQDNKNAWYAGKHGFSFSRSTEFYVQGDIRKCYPSMKIPMIMGLLRHDVGKNEVLLWFVEELLKMHTKGLIIGSLLSQFLCNYITSFAIREVFSWKKTRRGKEIQLIHHQLWYMDDFILTGPDRRNVKMAYNKLGVFLRRRFGLELKPAFVRRWTDAPPDIMGYVIHSDGTITIRDRIFIRAKRAFTRAAGDPALAISQARSIISYKGRFINSDCTGARKRLNVEKIAEKAQKLISDFDTGRLFQCLNMCSTAAGPPPSPDSSIPTEPPNFA